MGSKGSQTTTSSSTPPKAIMDAYQTALGMASQATSRSYQQYTGQLVAGLSPSQTQGISNINAAQGMALPAIQQGMGYTNQAAQGITPGLYNRFYSPYIRDVANATQNNLLESNRQQLSGLKGGAIQAGAFGGDRSGIAAAELARQQDLAMGQTMGDIYQKGYGQAMGLAGGQVQNLGQMGQQLANLGVGAQGSVLQGGQAEMAAGAQQQATQQAQLQAQYDQYQQYQAYPYQQAQFYGNIAEGLGAGAGGSGSTSTPGPSLASTIFGGLGALGSIYNMSDERVKEDITPVGKLKDGQTVYSYKYKGEPNTQIGLLAQEVEKTHPEAVKEFGGLKAVNYAAATRDARASGGGLVVPEEHRGEFAFGGIPYLTEDQAERLGWIPKAAHGPKFGKTPNLPDPPKPYEDQPLDKSWYDTNPLSADQVQGLKGLVSKVIPSAKPVTSNYDTSYLVTDGLNSAGYARGGTAHYAGGGLIPPPASTEASSEQSGAFPPPALPSPSAAPPTAPKSRNLIESLLNRDMSPEAKAAVLNASFALMASRSPWFGVALGDAGKVGTQTYYNALGQQRDLAKTAAEVAKTNADANLVKAQTQKMHYDATGTDLDNYYKAKAASPDPAHYMLLQDWVDQNGEHALADKMRSTGSTPAPVAEAPAPTDKQTPQGQKSQNLPEPPPPGNILATESGPDEKKTGTLPWLNAQISDKTAKLHQNVGSPYFEQEKSTLDAMTAQRDAIKGSLEYKSLVDFQNTDPLMRQALATYMKLNTSYNGGTLAEAQSDLLGIAQTLGLKDTIVPKSLQDTKEAHDVLLKSAADMISVLSDKSSTASGAPATTIGLEHSRVPGPEADPNARQQVATKLLALQNYNKDLFNTWDQGTNFAVHQKQFMVAHPLGDYMKHAEAHTPAAVGEAVVTSNSPSRAQAAISQLNTKFPDAPLNTTKWDPLTHAAYIKTKNGWVPK